MHWHAALAGWSPAEIVRAVGGCSGGLPSIDFVAEAETCSGCGGAMVVEKSRTRTVITLAEGTFFAREIRKRCAQSRSCSVIGSRALAKVVKPRQRFGYDLLVHVGLARYLRGKQREEICDEVRVERGIELCAASVSQLCDRFLLYFERLHVLAAPRLRAAMQGSYPLHLDATCEKGKGGLLVTMDGWREWVLVAARIPTEKEAHIRPVIERTVALFGDPVATVRDLAEAGARSCRRVRERGIPDLVCHYHFLAAVGKKLLEEAYSRLRSTLRPMHVPRDLRATLRELRRYHESPGYQGQFRTGVVRKQMLALVLWIIEGDGKRDHLFPFALPHLEFVLRCRRLDDQADSWIPRPRSRAEHRALGHIRGLFRQLSWDKRINAAVDDLQRCWQAFSELRDVLRLSNAELPRGDARHEQKRLPEIELRRLADIEQEIDRYLNDLRQRVSDRTSESRPHSVISDYIKRYRSQLFGHPTLRDADGTVLKVVDRTNNVLEHFFGCEKQRLRRRLGRAHLARDLAQQPAQAALVSNLRHPEYVRVLCGSLESLPAHFAALDDQAFGSVTPLFRDHRDSDLWRCLHDLQTQSIPVPALACQSAVVAAPSHGAHALS